MAVSTVGGSNTKLGSKTLKSMQKLISITFYSKMTEGRYQAAKSTKVVAESGLSSLLDRMKYSQFK